VGTLDREFEEAGKRETRERLQQFPYAELEKVGISEQIVLAVVLTIENWLRVEKYSLADQAREELIAARLSEEVARLLAESLRTLKHGRRSRFYATKQAVPLQSGPTPWPAPFVSALVFDAMLKRREEELPELINKIVIALGGSPDQLARYRQRLATEQVPAPSFAQRTSPHISVIEWLAISFEHYQCCWTEQPRHPYYYVPDGRFFEGLPSEAITAFVYNSISD
jgi:hypothetical protein